MDWRVKATIQATCAHVPKGDAVYQQLQRRFGALSPDPTKRIAHHLRMMRMLADHSSFRVNGTRCLEVGTGHVPVLPLLFHLCGAREVVTVDLHRRMQWSETAEAMRRMAAMREELTSQYDGLTDTAAFADRLAAFTEGSQDAEAFCESIGIRYVAPGDAATMPDPESSYDLHFSTTVLEHVPPNVLGDVLVEARRLLKPDGYACHLVDPSDHFAHADPKITYINFLRFSDTAWRRMASNEFAYCNRLRAPSLVDHFTRAGLAVQFTTSEVDARSVAALRDGFPLDAQFEEFTAEEVAAKTVGILARAE